MRFKLFREKHPEFKPYGPNLSSRFSEYGFRFARKDTPNLSARGFTLATKHYLADISMQASAPQGLHIPSSKHGERLVEHSIRRVKFDPPPPGWFPCDLEIVRLIDQGLDEVRAMYYYCCNLRLDPSAALFGPAWKHFDLERTWQPKSRAKKAGTGSAAAAAPPGGDDQGDDGDGGDDDVDEDAADIVVADADDMAEAARLIGALVAQHSGGGDEPGPSADADPTDGGKAALSRRLSAIFCTFNKSIQEEWNLRKFRFRQLKLLRTREQASGRAAAGERDVITYDDNLVVLWLDDAGLWSWALGHVEAIIVARTAVPANKCSPPELLIAARTADFRHQVDIDDPNAMFQFRWFSELDKNGKPLEGYGNPACTAYHLPISEHAPVFEWT